MQQPPQMIPVMPSFPPTSITTEQIQKYLDENKKLIVAILDNQNIGKLAECAQYQAQLQKNLMYLAAIADAQPQVTTMPSQFSLGQLTPHAAMQQGAYFMQHPQATAMAQQQGIFPQKMPLQFNNPHQMQEQQLLHQQAVQGQMGMRPGGMHNGPRSDSGLGAGSSGPPSVTADLNDGRGGSKQDGSEASPTGGDRPGGTNISHGGRDGESLCTKGPRKGK